LKGDIADVRGREVAVRVAGTTLTAIADQPPAIGAAVVLAVRPEKISFRDGSAPAPLISLNAVEAVVRDVTFVGEMHRYVLEIAPGTTLVAKQQHRFQVKAHAPAQRVTVEWHVEDTLIV